VPQVAIPKAELNNIDLPPVCVVTGETQGVTFEPMSWRGVRLSWGGYALLVCGLLGLAAALGVPGWGLVVAITVVLPASLMLTGVVLMVSWAVGGQAAHGVLPVSEVGRRRLDRVRRSKLGVVVIAAGLGLVAVVLWLVHELSARNLVELEIVLVLGAVLGRWIASKLGPGLPRLLRLDGDDVVLEVADVGAAAALNRRLHHWNPGWTDLWCTRRSLEERVCATHADQRAPWICGRCGAFACDACLKRVRADAMPICSACFARRDATAQGS